MIVYERCVNCYWDHGLNEIVKIDPTKYAEHEAHVTHPAFPPPGNQSWWLLKMYTNQVLPIINE